MPLIFDSKGAGKAVPTQMSQTFVIVLLPRVLQSLSEVYMLER